MITARTLLFAVGAIGLTAGAAHASGWGGRYGVSQDRYAEQSWRYEAVAEAPSCPSACRGPAAVQLPASFFEGDAGVGPWPDFVESGGGGGSVVAGGEGEATAFASASASAHISIHSHVQPRGHGGRHCK